MSEEKPTFKITDRRLFNPDGTPRDVEIEEEPAAAALSGEAGQSRADAASDEREAAGAAQSDERAASPESSGDSEAASASETERAEGARTLQEFLMAVEFIASFAADALGMVEHPVAGQREVNLPLARQCIDMLAALKEKTHGNLSADERHLLETILSQLRMHYVRLNAPPGGPAGPRGFSGSDITGGR